MSKYLQQRGTKKFKTTTSNHFLKPLSTSNKPCFEASCQKVAQNVAISLGYFIFSKNHNEPPKVAQLAKNWQIWSPCSHMTGCRQ
jgi:hypothetical protein